MHLLDGLIQFSGLQYRLSKSDQSLEEYCIALCANLVHHLTLAP